MQLDERSYSTKIFRPKPEIYYEQGFNLIIVATPWGNKAAARKVADTIQEYYLSSQDDSEVTSPFPVLTCLSPLANALRVGVMLANDSVYREINKSEYSGGVELFVGAYNDYEFAWAQVGCPHLFLDREGLPILPLGTQTDMSIEYAFDAETPPPLPNQLMGLENSVNLHVYSIRPQPGDRFVLLSRSQIPPQFYALPYEDRNIDSLSESISLESSQLPYWLGHISISE